MGLAFLCTPLYIHFLGIEAYGLIGFYIALQASVSFLEMGLSRACNRELARLSGEGLPSYPRMSETLRTLELIYWVTALLIGIAISVASPWIASSWLSSDQFKPDELEDLLVLIAWVIALRWPVGVYSGALMGLQRQVMMNGVQIITSVLNWVGSVLVLWLVDADLNHFFQWQLIVAICSSIFFACAAWYAMPGQFGAGGFSVPVMKELIPFAAAVGGNAILGTILLQADKLILSAMLSLEQFGFYALATVIANMISTVAGPVSNALFPRFSQQVGAGASERSISGLYHLACQAVSVLIVPSALILAIYPYEALYVYTGSEEIAASTATILAVLVVAKMCHASGIIPYALQLAYGWVRLSISINLISVAWIVPSVYWLSSLYGAIGAAYAWLVVTIGYVIVGMPMMHRRILAGEWSRWFSRSFVVPVLASGTLLLISKWLIGAFPENRWQQGGLLICLGTSSLLLVAYTAPEVRRWIENQRMRWRKS